MRIGKLRRKMKLRQCSTWFRELRIAGPVASEDAVIRIVSGILGRRRTEGGASFHALHELKVWQKDHQLTLGGLSDHGHASSRGKDYELLAQHAIEVKRMLAALISEADRS